MILFKNAADLQLWLTGQKKQGKTVGFVPTMGALHEGHLHLIDVCRSHSDLSVCSIFVNPAQFNDPKDYEKYPVTIEKDIQLLTKGKNDVLFLPSVIEMYPGGMSHLETYHLGELENLLEGKYRPGHFQGVCQVMSRLLKLVEPDDLFMGQKDFQQCLVIQVLIRQLGLNLTFHTVPTVREADGLAKSSRNIRLTPDQRQHAVAISRTLEKLKTTLVPGENLSALTEAARSLEKADFKTDYISINGASDLHPIKYWDGKEKAVALIAAFQGEVRLIDNMLIN